jgi:hypothetical protein
VLKGRTVDPVPVDEEDGTAPDVALLVEVSELRVEVVVDCDNVGMPAVEDRSALADDEETAANKAASALEAVELAVINVPLPAATEEPEGELNPPTTPALDEDWFRAEPACERMPADTNPVPGAENKSVEKLVSASRESEPKVISAAGRGRGDPEEGVTRLGSSEELAAVSRELGRVSHDAGVSLLARPSCGSTKRISPGSSRLGISGLMSKFVVSRLSSIRSSGRVDLRIGRDCEARCFRELSRSQVRNRERTLSAGMATGMRISPK